MYLHGKHGHLISLIEKLLKIQRTSKAINEIITYLLKCWLQNTSKPVENKLTPHLVCFTPRFEDDLTRAARMQLDFGYQCISTHISGYQ